jgi:hypothetical protein
MKIIKNIEQGTDEWFKLRLGSIGGSSIGKVCTGGKGATRTKILHEKIGEILSGKPAVGYKFPHADRGVENEPHARTLYSFMRDVEVEEIAMIKEGKHRHYSADGLVGENGLVEIKTRIPSIYVEAVLRKTMPTSDKRQMQWGLFISQREWVDYIQYCPEIEDNPILIQRIERDEKLIEELDTKATIFISEMVAAVDKIKAA